MDSVLSVLVIAAFGLLIVLTGGVVYLTAVEWRDRRRLSAERLDGDTLRLERSGPKARRNRSSRSQQDKRR